MEKMSEEHTALITICDRTQEERNDKEVQLQLPLTTIDSLTRTVQKYFSGIVDFEVRYKANKEEKVLSKENLSELSKLIASKKIKKIYLFPMNELESGKRCVIYLFS